MNHSLLTDQATFIAGAPRSGTTLMVALLDHHPDLLVFPEECQYLQPNPKSTNPDAGVIGYLLKEKARNRLRGRAHDRSEIRDDRRYDHFDYRRFEKEADRRFGALKARSPGGAEAPLRLVALIEAFGAASKPGHHGRWVVKNPRYEQHWPTLFKDFPSARVIIMLRDPRHAILSRTLKTYKKRFIKDGGAPSEWRPADQPMPPPVKFINDWYLSLVQFHRLRAAFPERVTLVRYEDLVADRRPVMEGIARFLQVDWNDALLCPSFLGSPWQGNSMFGRPAAHAGERDSRVAGALAPHHVWQIEAWLGDSLREEPARYAPSGVLDSVDMKALLQPIPGEGRMGFFRNRLRMWSNWRRLSKTGEHGAGGGPVTHTRAS